MYCITDPGEAFRLRPHDGQPDDGAGPLLRPHQRYPAAVPLGLPCEARRGHDHAGQVCRPGLQGARRARLQAQSAGGARQGSTVSLSESSFHYPWNL